MILGRLRTVASCLVIGYLLALAYAAPVAFVLLALLGSAPLDHGHAVVLAIASGADHVRGRHDPRHQATAH